MARPRRFASLVIAAISAFALSATSAAAVEARAKSAVNVRSGPGTSYSKIDVLYSGEPVSISECQGSWCYIQHDGPDGWVSGNYLVATGSTASPGTSGGDAAAAAIMAVILGGLIANKTKKPDLPYGPDTCKAGYVWRDAIPGDHVCVTPDRRTLAANENAIAGSRVNPLGAYGPNSCKSGYVWREAYSGDVVCVTPARRTQVHQENVQGPSHRVNP